ncbi:hypothetical protein BD413DRAFT_591616 [Trametes elegans]|nr:hypothetical protein BD413DRAFT_591616 [Trametes elegans]
MSSPIAIPRATKSDDARAPSPASSAGVYVPVHKRGASASSLPGRDSVRLAVPSPKTRARSVSPSTNNRYDLLSANIPPASMIPTKQTQTQAQAQAPIYSFSTLLALASSPAVGLAPAQRAQVDAHIPLMMSRTSPRASPARAKKSPSATATTAPAPPAAPEEKRRADAPARRRRTGRKQGGARAAPDTVEGRRRQRHPYGAGWGWAEVEVGRAPGQRPEFGRVPDAREASWRMYERAVVVAA